MGAAGVEVVVLGALKDNFMYLIVDRESLVCAAIDPVDPKKIIDEIDMRKLDLKYILTTHSHWDHDGGNVELVQLLKQRGKECSVIGGRGDGVKAVTMEVDEGDIINVGKIQIKVLDTAFHTPGHVCYYLDHHGDKNVFTGDTLFVAGCGNLNSGSKEQLYSAFKKLGNLPKDTKVYVGHEYTAANLRYALSIESDNEQAIAKYKWSVEVNLQKKFTVPSTIESEHETSPFMRAAFNSSEAIAAISGFIGDGSNMDRLLWVRKDKSGDRWKKAWEEIKLKHNL